MKKLLLLTMILSTVNVFAGVRGDKIHFQKDSTWVSAAYSKSLCLNDENVYEAYIRKCTEWTRDDERRCVSHVIVKAYQPMESTRERCKRRGGGDDDRCTEWETVPYIQNRIKKVVFTRNNDDEDVIRTEIIRIPDCN